MATEVGTAYVTLIPSARGFGARMQSELSGDIRQAGMTGGTAYSQQFSGKATSGISSRAGAMFSKLKVAGVVAAGAAGVAITKTLVDSIGAASDLNETLSKAGQVFGEQAVPRLQKFADAAATNLGQSKQEALDAASTFGVFGKSAGLTGDKLVGFSTRFTTLASDLASFQNTTPQEAIDALGAALRGENEPIRRYGVLLDDATMRQEALRLGIVKNTKTALTPQQKVLAAQALIFKKTKDAQGDFARTSGGLANQQRILASQWENMKTSIGQGLLPIVLKVVRAFNQFIPMLSQGATTISTEIGPAIDGLTDQFTEMWDAQGKGSKRLDDTVSNLKQWGADLVDIFSGVFGILEELWHTFGDDILRYVITVFDALRLIIGGGLRVIKGIINLVLALLRGDWSAAWDAIKDIVFGAFDVIKGMFKLQLAVWRLVFSVGWKIIRGVFVRAWEGIRDAVKVGIAALVRLVKALPGLLRSALSGLGALLRDLMVRAWNGAKAALGNALDWIVNQVRALPGHLLSIGKSLYNAGKSLIESFVNGLKQSPGFVSNIAGAVWDAVKGMINAAIDAINSALSINIDWPGPGSFSWHASIPHLQQGGRARNATLAMIGEGREPETVLPDSMLRGLLERTAGGAGTVGRLTITNWAEGTGYFQLVARGEVAGERAHRRDLRTMHA